MRFDRATRKVVRGVFAKALRQSGQRALDGQQAIRQPLFRRIGQIGAQRRAIGLQPNNLYGGDAQDQDDGRSGYQCIKPERQSCLKQRPEPLHLRRTAAANR